MVKTSSDTRVSKKLKPSAKKQAKTAPEPTTKQLWKKFFSPVTIVVCIFLVFNAVYFAQRYYFDHVDRPFVEGTRYVGRFYNSGCVLYDVFICGTSPKTEEFYYETDMGQDEVKSLLKDARVRWQETGELALELDEGRAYLNSPGYGYNVASSIDIKKIKSPGKSNILMVNRGFYNHYNK